MCLFSHPTAPAAPKKLISSQIPKLVPFNWTLSLTELGRKAVKYMAPKCPNPKDLVLLNEFKLILTF